MRSLFQDRDEAGRALAARLADEHLPGRVVVLALPRGGVPVAAEIASALEGSLDVILVRKIGVPMQPELAMGEHRYDIADYGLTEDYVRERFGKDYCERHGFGGKRP